MSKDIKSTLNNHVHVSYNEDQNPFRKSTQDTWNFRTGKSARPVTELRAELLMAAHQIHMTLKKEFQLYMDGSFPSQVMAQAFRWAKIPFSCVIPRFKNNENTPSFGQSVLFCETNFISYDVLEIDIEKTLMSGESFEWAQKYCTDKPWQILAMHLWITANKQGKAMIFPFGIPYFERHQDGWKVLEDEKDFALMRFQADQGFAGVPLFFKWSPEVQCSFLQDPVLRMLTSNLRREPYLTDGVMKEICQNYFQMTGEMNYHGFEKLEMLVKRFHHQLKEKVKGNWTAYSFNFADYCSSLEPQMVKAPKKVS